MGLRRWALGLLCLAWSALGGATEVVYGTASQGASINKRATTARVAALGGNGASLEAGADSLLSNPAALSKLQGLEFGVHHQSWLANITQEQAVAGLPTGWGGTWGLGLGWVDYGSIDAVDDAGEPLGSVNAQDYDLSLAWARAAGAGFSIGALARYGQELLAGESLSQGSVDLGLHWSGGRWQLGMVFANLASTLLSGDRAPSAVRGEVSADVSPHLGALRANAGFSAEPGGLSRLQAGLESVLVESLVARAGYEARLGSTLVEGFSGATFGLGFSLGSLTLDYAYLPFGDLGAGQRLSLKWRLGAAPAPTAVPTALQTPLPLPREPVAPARPPLPVTTRVPTPAAAPTLNEDATQVRVTEDALDLARKAEDAGNWDSALAIHQGLLARFPHNPTVWRSLGDLHYRAGHKAEAVAAYDKALENGLLDQELGDWLIKYRSQP